jgi:NAD(P)-dependent dehydrogenase (short-subunit alcohol dehydrogenase family)
MKVAIITGASKGIGASVAEALAVDGYITVLVARSEQALRELANKISPKVANQNPVVVYPLDVQDHEAIQAVVSDVHSKFGRVDLLFNNAGIDMLGTMDVSIEDFDKTIAINLRGAFSFLKAVVPIMEAQQSGTIINVASRAGKIGFPEFGVYGASKFGLVGLNEALYRQLSHKGIKVTALCPGWVDTDMAKDSGLPKEEMISTEDIVTTVRWLLYLSPAAVVKELVIECRKSTAL